MLTPKLQLAVCLSIISILFNSNLFAQGNYNIEQTLSDEAQMKTIAFDALAFMTGDLGCDSFLPPGKVADFSGFQYFRDNDPTNMGHNTDFVTIIAFNVLNLLTDDQLQELIDAAQVQIDQINQYGYDRFPLMKAFRRLYEKDFPDGATGLSLEAVKTYSAELYRLDGEISYNRAELLGSVYRSFTDDQKTTLDNLNALNGIGNWPDNLDNPLQNKGLDQDVNVAVMTYASEMYSWIYGSVEADVYFCPERQGTYFGSFYMKDMPAMNNPGFSIDPNLTADMGNAMLEALNNEQSALITGLVDIQKDDLYGIVDAREAISIQLRKFITEETVDKETVLQLAENYGELDGSIIYNYAVNFSKVGQSLSQEQLDTLVAIRESWNTIPCNGAFLYSAPIPMPDIENTDFLFGVDTPADSPVPDDAVLEKLADGFLFTEGPCVRNDGSVVFSDIDGNTIYQWTESEGAEILLQPSGNSNGLAVNSDGYLLMAQHGDRQIGLFETNGSITPLATHYQGSRLNSPNDLLVKSDGSIYFTDPPYGISSSEEELGFSGVFRLVEGSINPVLLTDSLAKPNGIAFSPDESVLYVADTDEQRVLAYNVQTDGNLSGGTVFTLSNGYPDGLAVDESGNVYVAASDAGIEVYSSSGVLLDQVDVPERVRNLAFDTNDDFTLYITAGTSLYRLAVAGNNTGTQKLPDTGQTQDYTSIFGEDCDYTINPPEYTDNDDGTVSDEVTGLMWQKADGHEMTWENAAAYADSLSIGGYSDWRLPTPHELFNLLDHSGNPALNDQYFIVGDAEYWWTSDTKLNDQTRVWVANSGGGIGAHPKEETISAGGSKRFHVRCVRGEKFTSSFNDNGDGTVTDLRTGLVWLQTEGSEMSWEDALNYVENLTASGQNDWRLPNIKELRSINDEQLTSPSVNVNFFTNTASDGYWSSTTESNQTAKAWFVNFDDGLVSHEDKTSTMRVLCVRSGENTVTDIDDVDSLPASFQLNQNYPNPFNPTTVISYQLSDFGDVKLVVYDVLGREVITLVNEVQNPGLFNVEFNAGSLSSGVYIYRLMVDSKMIGVKKMMLMK